MVEDLKKVDTSVLDALIDLKRERDTLRQRLARLGEAGSQVSDTVMTRVRSDYETRLQSIESKAAELKHKAREVYGALKPLRETAQRAFETYRLDEEELKLRHQLGEFSDEEYRNRVAQLGEGRREAEDKQAEVSDLVARFVGAFDSPDDLDPTDRSASAARPLPVFEAPEQEDEQDHTWVTPPEPPPAPAPPPPPPSAETALSGAADSAVSPPPSPGAETADGGWISPPADDSPSASAAAAAPAPMGGSAGSGARLQALDGDIQPAEFALETLTFVGRTPENQVRIYKPAVSRRHAQIASTDSGWLLRDLSSENGTYVNGQRITERMLADGDRVQFGTSRFIFKLA